MDLGFEETLNSVASEIKTQGPFDGILSFSQGACLASVICMLKAKGDDRFQDFGFAIIAAGYRNGFLAISVNDVNETTLVHDAKATTHLNNVFIKSMLK